MSHLSPLTPIGVVRRLSEQPEKYPFYHQCALELDPQYEKHLYRIEENSHIWVICQFDHDPDCPPQINPARVNKEAGLFGVMALRSPNHPNPLSLTLTRLTGRQGTTLYVETLDAFDGTPILDVKPYYDDDLVFSPGLPPIPPQGGPKRLAQLRKLAWNYHQEECPASALAIRTALCAEELGFTLQDPQLTLEVQGDPCYADTLQGLCRARLANPPRFSYRAGAHDRCRLQDAHKTVELAVRPLIAGDYPDILTAPATDLLTIIHL